jgi:glutaredoxin
VQLRRWRGWQGWPPLLTHDDVTTLFHEFGHGLHHMLTQVNERDVAGISGVEWDAVELPSQFMENFCWEWDVLRHMTAHVDTGEPLPRTLFDKMIAAKNFQSGMQTLRQIEFALFDMLLHTEHDPAQDFMPLLDLVRAEVAVLQPPADSRTAHTFSHIFAGGYAAGYYSYKWAEVLSADAYAAFEETSGNEGLPSPETGRKYRQPNPGGRRQPAGHGVIQGVPRTRAESGCAAAPPGHGLTLSMEAVMNRKTLAVLTGSMLIGLGSPAVQAQTLYRSVGPDGKVTFSDTPPPPSVNAMAKAAGSLGGAASPGGALPYELQQIASRYPVTLYTGDNCGPCASGRNLLNARGIPFAERTVNTPDDVAALQRMSGDISLPFMTIGAQQIKGYSDTEWTQFLDAAGYPKTSQLPPGYRAAAPAPFVAAQRPALPAPGAAAAATGGASGEPTVETFNTRPRPAATPTPGPNTNPANIRF